MAKLRWSDVRIRIKNAPSFNALHKAALRHVVALWGRDSDQIPEYLNKWADKPELLLTAYACVMNRKSARALTLERLTCEIFSETRLPREAPGKFRGRGLDREVIED